MNKEGKRLFEILAKAYDLALQVQDDRRDEQVMQALAEELSGETGELLALIERDWASFGDDDCMDSDLVALVTKLEEVLA
jgi:hypothetical protein